MLFKNRVPVILWGVVMPPIFDSLWVRRCQGRSRSACQYFKGSVSGEEKVALNCQGHRQVGRTRHWKLGPLEGRRRKIDEKVAEVQRPCDGQTFQCAVFQTLFLLAQGLSSNMKLLRAPAAEHLVTRRQPLR